MKVQHKFKNVIVERNNIKFRSKKEARYYDKLILAQKSGLILFFLMQVPFHLPGGIKYVCDFQVFFTDGTIEFVDTKGKRTKEFIRNKKQVETLYPVKIIER